MVTSGYTEHLGQFLPAEASGRPSFRLHGSPELTVFAALPKGESYLGIHMRTLQSCTVAGVTAAIALLSACDNKPAEAPAAPVAEAAPVASPPPPPTAEVVLAGLDKAGLCELLGNALSAKGKVVTADGCTATAGASDITLATADGVTTLPAAFVSDGSSVTVTAANASPIAVADARGGFSNVGMVFAGYAPAAGLCMQVEYFAPDGSSNSLFVWRNGEPVRVQFDLNKHETKLIQTYFPEPVIAAGKSGAFAVYRREPGLILKTVNFLDCSKVPPPEPK